MTSLHITPEIVFSELFRTGLFQTMREGCSSNPTNAVASPKERLYKQMTSNPAFTERNIQKSNAYLLYSRQEQKSLVTYHTPQSLYVFVSLVNTLISTAPIGSPIMCMRSPAVICEQWERNLTFSSADVRGAGAGDEPLRTSAWETTQTFSFSFFKLRYDTFACTSTAENFAKI